MSVCFRLYFGRLPLLNENSEKTIMTKKIVSVFLTLSILLSTVLTSCTSGSADGTTAESDKSTSVRISDIVWLAGGEISVTAECENISDGDSVFFTLESDNGDKTEKAAECIGDNMYNAVYSVAVENREDITKRYTVTPFVKVPFYEAVYGEETDFSVYSLAKTLAASDSSDEVLQIISLGETGNVNINGADAEVGICGFESISFSQIDAYNFSSVLSLNVQQTVSGEFNKYTVKYSSSAPLKGRICYSENGETVTEEFYLAKGDGMTFSSFADFCDFNENKSGNYVSMLEFENLADEKCTFSVDSILIEKETYPDKTVTKSNSSYSMTVDLSCGGKLCTLKTLNTSNGDVEYISSSNGGAYSVYKGTESTPYDGSTYTPTQNGGKLISYCVDNARITVTVRPYDAGNGNNLADCYITTSYTLYSDFICAETTVYDFYEYGHELIQSQNLPMVRLNNIVDSVSYYDGDEPWSDGKYTVSQLNANGIGHTFKDGNTEREVFLSNSNGDGICVFSPACDGFTVKSGTDYTELVLCRDAYLPTMSEYKYSYLICCGDSTSTRKICKENKDFEKDGVSDEAAAKSYTENGAYITTTNGETVKNVNNYICGPMVATDDLGRTLSTTDTTKLIREDRYVGLFYFLWLGEHGDSGIFDNTKILEENSNAYNDENAWGPVDSMHFFAEPLYGYYKSSDEWVMRKHIEELTNANVDFLYIDVTNGYPYISNAKKLMSIMHEFNEQGWKAPQIVFYTHTNCASVVSTLYENIYSKNYLSDTWFCIDGKPVIVAYSSELSDTYNNYFEIREPQWPNDGTKHTNAWPWMSFFYSSWNGEIFYNDEGKAEAISVSVAQHCGSVLMSRPAMYSFKYGDTGDRGRSYHNGSQDATENAYLYGYNFQERWDEAISADVPYVLVTSWNEWVAQRQTSGSFTTGWGPFKKTYIEIKFVDTFNVEYSRDIEMTRGYYFDNYYMQLVENIRKYKGTSPTLHQSKRSDGFMISMDSWDKVQVTYRDFSGDTADRNGTCFGSGTITDTSGRNDITEAKVCFDSTNLYFYVKCASDITKYEADTSWMQLFVDIDNSASSGWYGYDYIVNFGEPTDGKLNIAKYNGDGKTYSFAKEYEVDYLVKDDKMMVTVPLSYFGLNCDDVEFAFKWADSETYINTVEQFYTDGDAAPLGRLNFLFTD